MKKGIVPIVVLVVVILIASIGIGTYYFKSKKADEIEDGGSTGVEVTPSATAEPLTEDGKPVELKPTNSKSPTKSEVQATSTPIPTSVPVSTSIPVPTSIPTPKAKSTCDIVVDISDSNPMALKLIYSVRSVYNTYMAAAQWDFNGDGSWDTGWSQSNGTITHTFPYPGSHNVKLHLQMSDGETTNVCSKTVTVPQGTKVTFSGRTFKDINCNNVKDSNEEYVSAVTVNIFRQPGYSLYKTLISNPVGSFSFSTLLNTSDSLTISPSAVAPPYYKIYYSVPNYTLTTSATNVSTMLSLIPAANIGNCPF